MGDTKRDQSKSNDVRMSNMLSGDIGGPTFGLYEYGVHPWEDWDLYRRHSPLTYAPKVTTPLLIQHGDVDFRTGVIQSQMLYKSLKFLDRPVEAAILHNFAWHQRWTWRARPASTSRASGFVWMTSCIACMRCVTPFFSTSRPTNSTSVTDRCATPGVNRSVSTPM